MHASPSSLVVLSPHHDDAALSLGSTLLEAAAAGAAVHILNAFTVSAHAPHAGVEGIPAVSELRSGEDQAFVAQLPGAVAGDLGRRDAPLRGYSGFRFCHDRPFDADERAEVLDLALQLRVWVGHDVYYVPLALGSHIDHRIARAAAERAWAGAELRYYEDMPYGALESLRKRAGADLARCLGALGSEPVLQLGGGARSADDKRALVACYGSQFTAEEQQAVVVHAAEHGGERWWRRPR